MNFNPVYIPIAAGVLYVIAAIYVHTIGPKIVWLDITPKEFGRNARNGWFKIEICRDLGPMQSSIGVLAQEVYELRHRWRGGWLKYLFPRMFRSVELNSHTVECMAAEMLDGQDFRVYASYEAPGMKRDYSFFKDDTEVSIYAEMLERRPWAQRVVRRMAPFLVHKRFG